MTIRQRLLANLCVVLWASALSAQTHFACDYRQYQYDMAIYFMLQTGGENVSAPEDYEVAAFVGDECRGVGEFFTTTGANGQVISYGYLRVYSNQLNGETFSFKYYDKQADKYDNILGVSIDFVSNAVIGLPSSPQLFSLDILMGDVNGDGLIDVADISAMTNYILERSNTVFIEAAADMNGDGSIDVSDVSAITNIILEKQ